jgi:hypothetical protein
MCIAGRLGMRLALDTRDALFSDVNGCLLVEVLPAQCATFAAHFNPASISRLGAVTDEGRLVIEDRGRELISLPISDLFTAWSSNSGR